MKKSKIVYRAPGMLAAQSIQILLESFNIKSSVIQESAGIVYGLTAGNLGAANIYVSEENEHEAKKIIEMMEKGELKIEEIDVDNEFENDTFELSDED